jgi:uncharacterized protein YsxB (DUF464 family)
MVEKYCKQVNKYIKDCVDNYKFVNDRKQKIMIDFFVKQFDNDIYENIKIYVTEEQLYKSIETTINFESTTIQPLKTICNIYHSLTKNQCKQTNSHISTLLKVSLRMLEKTEEEYHKFIQTNDIVYTKMYLMCGLNILNNSEKLGIFEILCVIFNADAKMNDDMLLNICNLYRLLFVDSAQDDRSVFLEWRRMQNSQNHILRYVYYKIHNDILKLEKFRYTSCVKFSDFDKKIRFFDKVNYHLKYIFNENIIENKIQVVLNCDEISEEQVIIDNICEQNNGVDDDDDTSSIGSKDIYKKAMKNTAKTAKKLLKLGTNSSKKLKH